MSSEALREALKQALDAFAREQYKDCLQYCKAALKENKSSYEALILVGKAAIKINENQQAELAFRKAIDVNDDSLPAWQGLTELYTVTGNLAGSIDAYEHIIELTASDDPLSIDSRLYLADAYFRTLQYSKALNQLHSLLLVCSEHSTPSQLDVLCKIADIQLKLDEAKAAEEVEVRLSNPSTLSGRTMSHLQLDILSEQAKIDDEAGESSLISTLATICTIAPPAVQYLPYREEMLKRCLLRIFSAPPRSTERQNFRLSALRDCAAIIASGGACTSLPYEAAIWLLEEEEEVTGGQVPVGGQEVGGRLAVAGGVQAGAEAIIGSGRHNTIAYAFENFARRLAHQFPTNSTARVCLALMLRRRSSVDGRPVPQKQRRELERLISSAMEDGRNDCASGYKALAELQYENRQYDEACITAVKGLRWLHARRQKGHEALTQIALALRLALAKSQRRLGKLDEAENQFKALAGWVTEGEAGFGDFCGSTPISIHQQALRGIALCQLARGDAAGARAQYERILGKAALGRGPAEHWAHGDYGWLLFQDGDLQNARFHMEQALKVASSPGCAATDSQVGEHHYRLGEVYWKMKGRYRSEKQFSYNQFLEAAKVEGHAQAPALAALGRYFEQVEQRPEQAARCFKKALALDPKVDLAGDGLVAQLLENDKHEAAVMLCREISTREPSAFWAFKRLGFLLLSPGKDTKPSEAVHAFQTALRLRPDDASTWEGLGSAYQALGRLTAALKAFSKAIELDTTLTFSLIQLGGLQLVLGSPEQSLSCYKRALELDENHPSALLGASEALRASAAAYARLGALGLASKEIHESIEYATRAVQLHGSLRSAWKQLGDALLLHHTIPVRFCSQSTSLSGSKSEEWSVESVIESRQEMVAAMGKARRAYAKALHLVPAEPSTYADVSATFYHERQLQQQSGASSGNDENFNSSTVEAERILRGGLRLQPDSPELWTSLGIVSLTPSLKEYALSRALQLNPKSTTAWAALARLYLQNGHTSLAYQCLEHARSHDPTSAAVWEAMAALSIANITNSNDTLINSTSSRAAELERAKYSEHAIGLGASTEGLLSFAESAVRGFGDGTIDAGTVLVAARKAVEMDPLNPGARNVLGLVLESRQDFVGAVEQYSRAIVLLPHSSCSYAGAGDNNPDATIDSSSSSSSLTEEKLLVAVKLNLHRAVTNSIITNSVGWHLFSHDDDTVGNHQQSCRLLEDARRLASSGKEGVSSAVVKLQQLLQQEHQELVHLFALESSGDGGGSTKEKKELIKIAAKLLIQASYESSGAQGAKTVLLQMLPLLQECRIGAGVIMDLWYILLAGTGIAALYDAPNSGKDSSRIGNASAVEDVVREARLWARQAGCEDAFFVSQLNAQRALIMLLEVDDKPNQRGTAAAALRRVSKSLHMCPWNRPLRASTAQIAMYTPIITHHVDVAQRLINDTYVKQSYVSINQDTDIDGGEINKVSSLTMHTIDTIAALNQFTTQSCTTVEAQLYTAAKRILCNPTDTHAWYTAALLSTYIASNNASKQQCRRALHWTNAALLVVNRRGIKDPEMNARLLISNSEAKLQCGDDLSGALLIAQKAIDTCSTTDSSTISSDVLSGALRQQARCYWAVGDVNKAEESLRSALQHAVGQFEAVTVSITLARLLIASTHDGARFEEALQIVKAAFSHCSKVASDGRTEGEIESRMGSYPAIVLLELAVLLIESGRYEDGKKAAQHAQQLTPKYSLMESLAMICQAAAALQFALECQTQADSDSAGNDIIANLGEARRLLTECLTNTKLSQQASVLTRVLLAQTENAGNLRKKQERVNIHVTAALEEAQRPVPSELLGLLGRLSGSKSLCARAVHVAPWEKDGWQLLQDNHTASS